MVPVPGNQRLQLAPSILTRQHGNKQGKLNTPSRRAGRQSLHGAGAGSCGDGPCGILLQQGHPWGAHSPATAGNSKLTLSPVPSAESSLHPGVTSPAPGLPPAAPSGAVLEAGTHTQRLSPSTREEKTPSRQTRAAPSLPPSSHNPDFYWPLLLQTSQGWAFTPLRERVSPNLPCTASYSSSPSPGAAECRRSCRSPRGFHHPALPQVWQLLKWVRPASENKEKQSNFVLALN